MGFFDKNSSTSNSTSASQTTPSVSGLNNDGSAYGLGNISAGKHGKNTITINETDAGAVASAFDFAGNAFDFADSAISDATALAADSQRTALSFADHAFSDVTALTGRVLDKQTTANLEFLGQVSNFAELSAQTSLENSRLSERQAADAIAAVQKANAAALDKAGVFAQNAQDASMKALDYVFEAGKSETARLSETALKWIVAASVLVFGLTVYARGR